MANKRTKLLTFGKNFIEKMEENDIWYSADVNMILGAQRHGGFIPWKEKFQVIMTPESFIKLQRLFPSHIVSSHYSKDYHSLTPSFVEDNRNWTEDQPFVQIKIVVPTSLKKIKLFRSRVHIFNNKLRGRKETTRLAINDLSEQRFEGFYVINSRKAPAIKNWIPNITFKMVEMKFNNINIKVIKEWEPWVIANYGEDYMKAIIPQQYFTYPGPLVKTKVEL